PPGRRLWWTHHEYGRYLQPVRRYLRRRQPVRQLFRREYTGRQTSAPRHQPPDQVETYPGRNRQRCRKKDQGSPDGPRRRRLLQVLFDLPGYRSDQEGRQYDAGSDGVVVYLSLL